MQTFTRQTLLFIMFMYLPIAGITQGNNEKGDFRIYLKVNPLSLLDPNYPTIQPSIELQYKRVAVVYKYGALATLFFQRKTSDSSYFKGHKEKVEIRYYIGKNNASDWEPYMALETFTGSFKQKRWKDRYYNKDDEKFTYDYALQQTKVWGVGPKLGAQYFCNQRLLLDFAAGFGVRNVDIKYREVKNLQQVEAVLGEQEWGGSKRGMEGKRSAAHLSFEANIGYKLF